MLIIYNTKTQTSGSENSNSYDVIEQVRRRKWTGPVEYEITDGHCIRLAQDRRDDGENYYWKSKEKQETDICHNDANNDI